MNAFDHYQLQPKTCDNLKIHMRILQKAHEGILMNMLTYRKPTRVYLTNACEICMGGFSSKCKTWRWQTPKEYWGRAHINLWEFCAELVSIWIDIVEDTLNEKEYLLSIGDIKTSIKWFHKAHKPAPNKHLLYSQWFPGSTNVIPNILSRDWHLDDGKILNLLTNILPTHMYPYV